MDFGYEILKTLGKGGMGIVYLAKQTNLGRTVALKMVLDKAVADPESIRRFELEAKSLARLDHPNIVKVHDFGVRADGLPYFALEYCQGGSLADLMRKDSASPRQAARLVAALARAMGAAHQAGIVHRDLKPGNILLREQAEALDGINPDWLKIADFGLAKATDDPESMGHTQTGGMMGTPSYMAPEQAMNTAGAREPADIYALGVILYEMLTGRVPFRGKTIRDVLKQLEEDDPPPVSQLAPGTPRDLQTICLKCLEKNPERRYPDARRLADDLQAYLDDRTIAARPAGTTEKAIKWMRRNPGKTTGMTAAIAMAALMVSGAVVFFLERARNEQREFEVRLEEQRKSSERQREQDARNAEDRRQADLRAAHEKSSAELNQRAEGLIDQLLTASPEGVRAILDSYDQLLAVPGSALDTIAFNRLGKPETKPRERLELALVERHPELTDKVEQEMLRAAPGEIPSYAMRLKNHREKILPRLRKALDSAQTPGTERLRLGSLLAIWDAAPASWSGNTAQHLTEALVELNAVELGPWLKLVDSAGAVLAPLLANIVATGSTDQAMLSHVAKAESAARVMAGIKVDPLSMAKAITSGNERTFDILADKILRESMELTAPLADMADQDPSAGQAAGLALANLSPPEIAALANGPKIMAGEREQRCRRAAKAIATLAFLGMPEKLWESLEKKAFPDLQAEIRSVAPAFRIPPDTLAKRYTLAGNGNGSRQNIIILLGQFSPEAVSDPLRKPLVSRLERDYAEDDNPGIHGAIGWLGDRWGFGDRLKAVDARASGGTPPASHSKSWRVNSAGNVLVHVRPGATFDMGSGPEDPYRALQGRLDLEKKHSVAIAHGFEISSKEVTLGEYLKFKPSFNSFERLNPDNNLNVPVTGISWFEAIAYCQWLTQQERIPEKDWCFPELSKLGGLTLTVPENYVERKGYRLPTEQEWEFAARAGNKLPYPCGFTARHLNDYALTWSNGMERLWPVGTRMPNAYGLFDTSGNALEWTMDEFRRYDDQYLNSDRNQAKNLKYLVISDNSARVVRGGSITNSPSMARMAARLTANAGARPASNGFRICRTTEVVPDQRHAGIAAEK